jgi:hypothetical protein
MASSTFFLSKYGDLAFFPQKNLLDRSHPAPPPLLFIAKWQKFPTKKTLAGT